jgi:ATP-dependent Lon protease
MTRELQDFLAGAGPLSFRRPLPPARAEAGNPASPPIPVQTLDPAPHPPAEGEPRPAEFPSVIPILPLRGLVGYPHTPIPLTIGQPRSIRLIDDVVGGDRLVGLVTSRQPEIEAPGPDQLYRFGTIAVLERMLRAPDGTIRLLLQGLTRFELGDFETEEPYLKAQITVRPETVEEGVEIEAQVRAVKDQFQQIAELIPSLPRELLAGVLLLEEPLHVIYTVANYQRMELETAQAILEDEHASEKLRRLNGVLARELEVLSLGQQIQKEARTEIDKVQREYFLREQLKAIQRELGEGDEQTAEVEELRRKIDLAGMSEEADKISRRELDRLSRLPTAAAEFGVIRGYLDWLVALPWSRTSPDNLDLAHARQVLDQDHYGLKDVKERILEYLAVRKLKMERGPAEVSPPRDAIRREREGVILCFVGPPGVGKTSLGQSIARAMGRQFIRSSLGGVSDEAEIRGHRRTYVGAMPGRILQGLRRVESRNPVFMLDEVDKLGRDFRGDPASALLEVLDPEQNREFRDHYLEVAFDLSQVMFVTTANWLDTVPGPLLDRMEVIQLSGYTEAEKIAIARDYLVPRQLRENGLEPDSVSLSEAALHNIIRSYTREAGVRNLEREIGRLFRKLATRQAEGRASAGEVGEKAVEELLGRPRFLGEVEIAERTSVPGVATGLAFTPVGGEVLFIEATAMPGGREFLLTGSLGQVMQESARAALSYVRSASRELGIPQTFWRRHDIHLHIPAGAQPKDGPSAGVTIATALASLATGKVVRREVGMTGEITLRGQVLPIGGVKEKVLAAHRAGLRTVILPRRNEPDLEDVPEDVRRDLGFVYADDMHQVLGAALTGPARRRSDGGVPGDRRRPRRSSSVKGRRRGGR